MKVMIRIGAIVGVLAMFTSFTMPQDAQVQKEEATVEVVACCDK